MSRQPLPDYVHPVLGVFSRSQITNHLGEWFVYLQKQGSTSIPGLGYMFPDFSISLKGTAEPPPDMVVDLVQLVQWPALRKHEVEAQLFQHYLANRERYMEDMRDNDYSDLRITKAAPEIRGPAGSWQLITRARSINGGTWPQVSIAFDTTYDEEHELHVSFANDQVVNVWDE